jgi:hypothetical protein
MLRGGGVGATAARVLLRVREQRLMDWG